VAGGGEGRGEREGGRESVLVSHERFFYRRHTLAAPFLHTLDVFAIFLFSLSLSDA